MLLTVPILYYKPIQEQALKIKAGRKDRREERQWFRGRGCRGLQGSCEFKSNTVSFMFKGTFLFSKSHWSSFWNRQKCFDRLSVRSRRGAVNINSDKKVGEMFSTGVFKVMAHGDDLKAPLAPQHCQFCMGSRVSVHNKLIKTVKCAYSCSCTVCFAKRIVSCIST